MLGIQLQRCFELLLGRLKLLGQPQSQTVQQAQSVTFTANALGIPGDSDQSTFTYQWRVNGTPIADGTGAGQSYTINSAALTDSGKRYSVVVTTTGGLTATSAEATLTVIADATPPAIATVRTTDTFNIARVTFSEAVSNAAVTPSNYTLSGGLTVSDANFSIVVNDANNPEDPKNPRNPANRVTVILNTSAQTDGAVYDLTVNANIIGLVGNAISQNSAKMYPNTFKSGLVLHKRWYGLGHRNFQTLLANPALYDSPTATFVRTLVEENDADLDSQAYMTTLSGYFIPPTTGDHFHRYAPTSHVPRRTDRLDRRKWRSQPLHGALPSRTRVLPRAAIALPVVISARAGSNSGPRSFGGGSVLALRSLPSSAVSC